jgi:beta-lactamase class C
MILRTWTLAACLFAFGAFAAHQAMAQPDPAGAKKGAGTQESDDPIAHIVRRVVEPWLEKYTPPGAIVVVHREGATRFFPFGHSHPRRRDPVTPDSIFELASITKVFATTSLALEVEQGKMRLDDPVAKYLPILRTGKDIRKVTLRQLATHTSSLPRAPGPHPGGGPWNRRSLMEWLVRWEAPDPPGARSLYSNLAVGVLGDAIATAERESLQEVWNRQFLHPLEMHSTFFEIPPGEQKRLVQGFDRDGRPVPRAVANGAWPAGGRLCSSGRDMGRFLAANLGETPHRPLITQAMQLAQKPYFEVSPKMTQGLAWQRVRLHDELVIDKNGGLDGSATYIGMIPGHKLGVVVMANKGKSQGTAVGRALLLALAGITPTEDLAAGDEEGEGQ